MVKVSVRFNNRILQRSSQHEAEEQQKNLDYTKCLKQAKDILEAHIGEYILGNYVENLDELKNATGAKDKKKIKSEYFNKWMAYQLIANTDEQKYSSLENGLEIKYSKKISQYPKDLIMEADIMRNHQHDDSGTKNTENKTPKHKDFKIQNNIGYKGEKAT